MRTGRWWWCKRASSAPWEPQESQTRENKFGGICRKTGTAAQGYGETMGNENRPLSISKAAGACFVFAAKKPLSPTPSPLPLTQTCAMAVCMSVSYPTRASVQPYPVGCTATRHSGQAQRQALASKSRLGSSGNSAPNPPLLQNGDVCRPPAAAPAITAAAATRFWFLVFARFGQLTITFPKETTNEASDLSR